MIRLRHFLYLALLSASLASFFSAGYLARKQSVDEAVVKDSALEAKIAAMAYPPGLFWILISAGFLPLAAILLVRALVREERTTALLRAQDRPAVSIALPPPIVASVPLAAVPDIHEPGLMADLPESDSSNSARFLSSALHRHGAGAGEEGSPREPQTQIKGRDTGPELPIVPGGDTSLLAPLPASPAAEPLNSEGPKEILPEQSAAATPPPLPLPPAPSLPPPATPLEPAKKISEVKKEAENFPWGRVVDWSAAQSEPLITLWNTSCSELYSATPRTLDDLNRLIVTPEFDAEVSVVALSPLGELLGAMLVFKQTGFEDDGYWWLESPGVVGLALVDARFRKHGIGRVLLKEVETRSQRLRRPRLFVGGLENFPTWLPGVPAQDHITRVFFLSHGYREIRRTVHMEAPVGAFKIPLDLLERENRLLTQGYRLEPAEESAADAFLDFLERTRWPRPQRMLDRFRKNPGLFGFAWRGLGIAGFVQITPPYEQGRAGIKVIYLPDDVRGLGLGSLMLVKTHELWEKQGAKTAALWTYPEAAERFYPRAGFKVVQEWVCFVKELPHTWNEEEFVNRWRI